MEKNIQTLEQKCYDILTSKDFKNTDKLSEFFVAVFELAKQTCNAGDISCKIEVVDHDSEITYNQQQKTLYINPKLLKKRHLEKTIWEIFRTVYFEKQNSEIEYKQFGVAKKLEIPLEKTNDNIHKLPVNEVHLDTHALSFTSKNHKQARDFAYTKTLDFFKKMNILADKNNASDRQKRFIDIQRQKAAKSIQKEKYQYFECVRQLDMPKGIYETVLRTMIWDTLNQLRNNYIIIYHDKCMPDEKQQALQEIQNLYLAIDAISQAYCDEFYKQEIIFYCKRYDMVEPLYHIFNSPYSSITERDFDTLFAVTEKQNIPIETIKEKLYCWEGSMIEDVYNKYIEDQKYYTDDFADLF